MPVDRQANEKEQDMGIGNMSPEEAAKIEAEGAAQTAEQQAEFAESQAGYTGEAPMEDPATVDDAKLAERGFALATSMTSPGGPWHGLPPGAATDPMHPGWEENCRWACIEGSFFACTFDGTTAAGEHAENVRGYAVPTEQGASAMRSAPTDPDAKSIWCMEQGNNIAYRGWNLDWVLA